MKRLEEELRASQELQEYIVNTIQEGLLVLTLDLQVIFANKFFYDLFEVSEAETVGKLIYELGNGQWNIPELRMLLENILPDNKVFSQYEVTHTFQNIGRRVMQLNGRRLDGQQRILLAIKDITERQNALDRLKDLTNTLEEEVADRTRKIRELALELLGAEQKVRQYIAQVLHDDLQQILYSMRMRLQIIDHDLAISADTKLTGQLAQLDELITTAYVMTREMATDLAPPMPQGEDFGQSIRELAAQVAKMHHLQVNVTVVNGSIRLIDDELALLLLYIVREFLFNVVKHAQVNEAEVEVMQQAKELIITVLDHGKGFDVATPLERSHGTGLGLYSIERRLKLLGGRLEIDSRLGDGMRVTVVVPLGR